MIILNAWTLRFKKAEIVKDASTFQFTNCQYSNFPKNIFPTCNAYLPTVMLSEILVFLGIICVNMIFVSGILGSDMLYPKSGILGLGGQK